MFHLDPPPDFKSFDRHGELAISSRNLPHWRQDGATYFVTFRLADSMPQVALRDLKSLRNQLLSLSKGEEGSESGKEELRRELMIRSERWLDRGLGSCLLQRGESLKIMNRALQHLNGCQYHLGAYVIMPNHVHALIRPFRGHPLEQVLRRRKQWSARMINQVSRRKGPLWQEESFDRIIRDSEHLWKALQYIGRNPARAGLGDDRTARWVDPDWSKLGWQFSGEEDFKRGNGLVK